MILAAAVVAGTMLATSTLVLLIAVLSDWQERRDAKRHRVVVLRVTRSGVPFTIVDDDRFRRDGWHR